MSKYINNLIVLGTVFLVTVTIFEPISAGVVDPEDGKKKQKVAKQDSVTNKLESPQVPEAEAEEFQNAADLRNPEGHFDIPATEELDASAAPVSTPALGKASIKKSRKPADKSASKMGEAKPMGYDYIYNLVKTKFQRVLK